MGQKTQLQKGVLQVLLCLIKTIGLLVSFGVVAASCGNLNAPDYYGRFSQSWEPASSNQTNQLKHWLDPNGAGASFIDGFDPSGASAAEYDAGVSGAVLQETAVCATDYIPSFTLSNPGSQTLTSAVNHL